jgi:hypothetical protein
MSHDTKPNKPHSIVTIKLALHESDPGAISDGLNEMLGATIGEGFVADYSFIDGIEEPFIVTPNSDPEEGELFLLPQDIVGVLDHVVVVACSNSDGASALVPVTVKVTAKQVEHGDHCEMASEMLEEMSYEGPFVFFDQQEQATLKKTIEGLA